VYDPQTAGSQSAILLPAANARRPESSFQSAAAGCLFPPTLIYSVLTRTMRTSLFHVLVKQRFVSFSSPYTGVPEMDLLLHKGRKSLLSALLSGGALAKMDGSWKVQSDRVWKPRTSAAVKPEPQSSGQPIKAKASSDFTPAHSAFQLRILRMERLSSDQEKTSSIAITVEFLCV
jgi:hypothetical protein